DGSIIELLGVFFYVAIEVNDEWCNISLEGGVLNELLLRAVPLQDFSAMRDLAYGQGPLQQYQNPRNVSIKLLRVIGSPTGISWCRSRPFGSSATRFTKIMAPLEGP
ncbi:hypothetical protein HAX54_015713, partial [Datura stramonium]|nr:hypothetical protein [Datura stramonium]